MRTSQPHGTVGPKSLSRRKFLGGLGVTAAGAAAVAAAPAITGVGQAARRHARRPVRPDVPGPPAVHPDRRPAPGRAHRHRQARRDPRCQGPARTKVPSGSSPTRSSAPTTATTLTNMTAGTTFLGQFLDHDMTFDATSRPGRAHRAGVVAERRARPRSTSTPSTAAAPRPAPQLYAVRPDQAAHRVRRALRGRAPRWRTARRSSATRATTRTPSSPGSRPRSSCSTTGSSTCARSTQGVPPAQQFAQARRLVTWHYQWIIVNEFLPADHRRPADQNILTGGRRFYRPEPGPAFIPVEFQGAAYRFGHSMVRPSYRLNLAGNADGTPFFGFIFDPAGENQADPVDLRGGRRARRRFVGWQTFFDFGGDPDHERAGPTSGSTRRSPRRCSTCRWARSPAATRRPRCRSATCCATSRGASRPGSGSRRSWATRCCTCRSSRTTAWRWRTRPRSGTTCWPRPSCWRTALTLGPTGRAHRRRGLHRPAAARHRLVPAGAARAGRPTLPSQTPGTFKMTDLLRFARVDPASRGQ